MNVAFVQILHVAGQSRRTRSEGKELDDHGTCVGSTNPLTFRFATMHAMATCSHCASTAWNIPISSDALDAAPVDGSSVTVSSWGHCKWLVESALPNLLLT